MVDINGPIAWTLNIVASEGPKHKVADQRFSLKLCAHSNLVIVS